MIQFIMKRGEKVLEQDMLSPAAAKELIIGAVTGLVPDVDKAQEQIHDIWKAINDGHTIAINSPAGVSMIFQVFSPKKERQAANKIIDAVKSTERKVH